jgi:nucleoside-diphosphate-sugar epimerase
MQEPRRISVLGCGWLGLPLAQNLIQNGFKVKGSSTNLSKIAFLKQEGIDSFLVHCNPDIKGEQLDEFFNSDSLFLNIPFKRNLKDPSIYEKQINSVIARVKDSSIKDIIFSSSTSVYPSHCGDAKESLSFQPETHRSETLYKIEQAFLSETSFKCTIVRFAGLYGPEREIGKFLKNKFKIDGSQNCNLIHLDDCIEIIRSLFQKPISNQIFNACSDEHPPKKILYTKAAKFHKFKLPQFVDGKGGKVVNNEKIKKYLNYQFKHPNPLSFFDSH